MAKIAFYASIKVDIDGTTANKPFVFNNVITNVGDQTDGLFVFSLTVRQFSHSKYGYEGHFSIKRGNNVVMKVYPDMHSRESEFDTASGTTMLELSKEDTVYVVADEGGRYIEGDEDFSTYFSGYQIG
ncbi:hypothetical protein MAR_036314 [Mya arenaria]|uniref:C1q domain-containing protein n=1 Tax=Mya arenaria TaxID=6604 RepID=A0ABY7EMN1_MYAAR|nr:hypothetical protein MAR_036314 [Mya arenaria]